MTARHFIYGIISGTPGVTDLIGGASPRIFAKKTMTSSIEAHPYIVYKLGNETTEDLSEVSTHSRQYFQVWVHDYHDGEVADYDRIDAVIKALRAAFHLQNSAEHKVYSVQYLETSQDLNDETLNTVFKYLRFSLVKEE